MCWFINRLDAGIALSDSMINLYLAVKRAQQKIKDQRFVRELRKELIINSIKKQAVKLIKVYSLPDVIASNPKFEHWAEQFSIIAHIDTEVHAQADLYLKKQQFEHILKFYLWKYLKSSEELELIDDRLKELEDKEVVLECHSKEEEIKLLEINKEGLKKEYGWSFEKM